VTDPMTLTAEFRSWEWELVLKYEDGSLPAAQWNVETLTTVATWYAKNLKEAEATARYTKSYEQNHHRLTNRREGAAVATEAIDAVDQVWQGLLQKALDAKKAS
jgi:hypothetical protein